MIHKGVQNMNSSIQKTQKINLKDLVLSGLFIAIVFVFTYLIRFPYPFSMNSGGLIHAGNIPLFAIAIVFGKKHGAVAGGIGMALFNLLSPFAVWTPCTLIVRGIQGYMIGAIANGRNRNGNSIIWNTIAVLISTIWMLIGYFAYNLLLYGNFASAVSALPGDLIQTVLGIAGMFVLIPILKVIKRNYP